MKTDQRRFDSVWKLTILSVMALGPLGWAQTRGEESSNGDVFAATFATPTASTSSGRPLSIEISTTMPSAAPSAPSTAAPTQLPSTQTTSTPIERRIATSLAASSTTDDAASAGNEGAPTAIPKLASAKAQLEHAAGLKKAMRGTEGEARDRARKAAIDAYRAVREYFGDDSAACSEAAFRAGELLRASEDTAGALAEYTTARDRGTGTEFRVRAMLEIAHLERRAKHMQPALAAYESVVAEETATPRQKDEASLWAGRVHADLEHYADARRVWQRVADKGEDPLDRVKAWDFLVSLLIEQGDLEGAAGVLERCREAMSDVAAEESKLGERVRSALASMRCVDELTRAIEKRRNASEGSDKSKEGNSKSGKRTSGS